MSTTAEHIDLPTFVTPITPIYRGRFAPTPSGPLHLGSLFTALASWLASRQAGGEWRLRIDDLDRPRCVPGAEDIILRQLEAHGLLWEGALVRQSQHEPEYLAALRQLDSQGLLYRCICTRATLVQSALPGPDGAVYAGTCRDAPLPSGVAGALRFRVPRGEVKWHDGVQGLVRRETPKQSGDFVVRRADGQLGYHLACALDEQRMGITEVLRGADLIGSTAHQLQVLQVLGAATPRYSHVPVLLAEDSRKLSKQNGAQALETAPLAVARQLLLCLKAMRLSPPEALHRASAALILQWALLHWRRELLSDQTTLAALP